MFNGEVKSRAITKVMRTVPLGPQVNVMITHPTLVLSHQTCVNHLPLCFLSIAFMSLIKEDDSRGGISHRPHLQRLKPRVRRGQKRGGWNYFRQLRVSLSQHLLPMNSYWDIDYHGNGGSFEAFASARVFAHCLPSTYSENPFQLIRDNDTLCLSDDGPSYWQRVAVIWTNHEARYF